MYLETNFQTIKCNILTVYCKYSTLLEGFLNGCAMTSSFGVSMTCVLVPFHIPQNAQMERIIFEV